MGEKVVFSFGVSGMAMNLGEDIVDVVLFGEDRKYNKENHTRPCPYSSVEKKFIRNNMNKRLQK